MARVASGLTRAGDLVERLRAEILGGRRPPGERLPISAVAEDMDVSVTVAREALTRLAEQSLVDLEPQIGFRVTPLRAGHLLDLTRVREVIEPTALRWSIQHGDVTWESALVAAHHTMTATEMTTPEQPEQVREQWWLAHRNFHTALVAGCDSPILMNVRNELWDASELYIRWSALANPQGPQRDTTAEHRRLLDTALARDADACAAAMIEHIRITADVLLEGLPATYDDLADSEYADRKTR